MKTNWIEQINNYDTITGIYWVDSNEYQVNEEVLINFITTLLEKQREEIQDKLNKHWDKLETNDYDFKDMEDWRIFKCIRNNNNDVINDKPL